MLDKLNAAKYKRQPVFQEPTQELPSMRPLTAFGITSGVGSMLAGAHKLGFKVVGNLEWRDYYRFRNGHNKSTFMEHFPGAFMARGIDDVPKNMMPGSIDFAAGHPECLPGQTQIYTSTGWKRLKSIQTGELVLTHEGRFRPVIKVFENLLDPGSDWVEISLSGALKKGTHTRLNLTPNHPVWTTRGWVAAGDLIESDTIRMLTHPCLHCKKPIPYYRDFCSVSDAVGCGQEILRVLSNHTGQYEFVELPLLSVRKYQAKQSRRVFNLGVLDDNSFVAKGFAVHNCGRYSSLSHSVTLGSYQESRGADVSDLPLFLKLVANLQPKFFLMDDLPDSFGPLPMSEYIRLLPNYDLFPEWISNWGYGNIQKHRNRMFIVGALKSEEFTFIPGEEEHSMVLHHIIADLLDAKPGETPNHAFVNPSVVPGRYVNMRWYGERSSWGELAKLFEIGEWSKNLKYYSPEGLQKVRPGTTNPKWDGFCPVLSGGYNPVHPIRHSPLTIRERARIQGFPDDFMFHHDEEGPLREVWEPYNSDGQRGIKQTGKAMPLQFCTYVADQVKHFIEKKPFETSGRRVLKPNPKVTQAKLDYCSQSGYADQPAACAACWHRAKCSLFPELAYLADPEEKSSVA